MQTCYRHPSRETGVSCSSCGRPICTDCMTSTPVGMRCPECARQKTKVRTMRDVHGEPNVTRVLIAINVILFFATITSGGGLSLGGSGGPLFRDFALWGPGVADGEVWRLVTGGFLHSGLIHVGFNMYLLWMLGQLLEPSLGSVRFAALYVAALLAGSFGALLLQPDAVTVGASGAVFGLMGAAFVEMRRRGIDPMQSGIGGLLVLNLIITFIPGFNISIGGHVGGLIGGVLAALIIGQSQRYKERSSTAIAIVGCLVIAVIAVAGALAAAGGSV
jgi:membrane associated rhomboid family serine protease